MINKAQLQFSKTKTHLICLDSDGCVFDSMGLKHRECFTPQFINHWNLQPLAALARQAWELVNLNSRLRGANRFVALIAVLDFVAAHPEAAEGGYSLPDISPLRKWIAEGEELNNEGLQNQVTETGNPVLKQALKWSLGVNNALLEMVRNTLPFPGAAETLRTVAEVADIVVVSSTTTETLVREWDASVLSNFTALIAGQEMGSKAELIAASKAKGYDKNNVLKIGDSLGDLAAAKANDALFFPIIPERESECWFAFLTEGIQRFTNMNYAGEYQKELIQSFELYSN